MKKENTSDKGWTDKAAEGIAKTGLKVQSGFANGMGRLTGKLSPGKLKVWLLIFCVAVGGYCVYIFGDALFSPEPNSSIKVQQLKVPKHTDDPRNEGLLSDKYVDESTYLQVLAFKRYMDSLKVMKNPLFDSIARTRPGLMDSVQILIDAYEQFK